MRQEKSRTPTADSDDQGLDTPTQLLVAAEQLFADRGIYAPSLREITLAAGQRNNSALQYHFESREGLIQAIMAEHGGAMADRRKESLDRLVADNALDQILRVAEVAVRPYAEFLRGGPREFAYLCISADVYSDPSRPFEALLDVYNDPLALRITELLSDLLDLPDDIVVERLIVAVWNVVNAAAGRAQIERHPGRRVAPLRIDAFISNLVDMFVGSITAPASERTLCELQEAREET